VRLVGLGPATVVHLLVTGADVRGHCTSSCSDRCQPSPALLGAASVPNSGGQPAALVSLRTSDETHIMRRLFPVGNAAEPSSVAVAAMAPDGPRAPRAEPNG
jgi:hypothetical protein